MRKYWIIAIKLSVRAESMSHVWASLPDDNENVCKRHRQNELQRRVVR